jgi:hypothetical protein
MVVPGTVHKRARRGYRARSIALRVKLGGSRGIGSTGEAPPCPGDQVGRELIQWKTGNTGKRTTRTRRGRVGAGTLRSRVRPLMSPSLCGIGLLGGQRLSLTDYGAMVEARGAAITDRWHQCRLRPRAPSSAAEGRCITGPRRSGRPSRACAPGGAAYGAGGVMAWKRGRREGGAAGAEGIDVDCGPARPPCIPSGPSSFVGCGDPTRSLRLQQRTDCPSNRLENRSTRGGLGSQDPCKRPVNPTFTRGA